MKSDQSRFGLSVALATPFSESGAIEKDMLFSHADRCLENGCESVTFFGTTGEGPSLTAAERVQIFNDAATAGIAVDRMIAGVICNTVDDACRESANALEAGAKAVLLAPPHYFTGLEEEGIYGWYEGVLGRLGPSARDIILYNIPALTGVPLSIETITRLRDKFGPVIRGIKDSSADWQNTKPLVETHRDIDVLVGDERHLAAAVRLGASGAIGGLANLFPVQVRELTRGNDNEFIFRLVELVISEQVIVAIKALLAAQFSEPVWNNVRLPLTGLTGARRENLVARFKTLKADFGID